MIAVKASDVGSACPRVSIGMPLYNAERYLAETLDSLLQQTFTNFEIVISDNGSTDGTQQICQSYAARDQRIRYYRSQVNRGAAWNHNRVFELSRGEYFRWNSYDDLCAPRYLEACVTVLDARPDVVLCQSEILDIDEHGNALKVKHSGVKGEAPPNQRFRPVIHKRYSCEDVYGLIRSNVLRTTKLIGNYSSSDHNLLAELALAGKFYEIPEPLFLHRWHSENSWKVFPSRVDRTQWFDTSAKGRIVFPYCRQFYEFLKLIAKSKVSVPEKIRCYRHMVWFLQVCQKDIRKEVREGLLGLTKVYLPWTRTIYRAIKGTMRPAAG